MILQKEIRTKAQLLSVPTSTIDKDWVLGHVLCAIYRHPSVADNLIFKGGTCLRKLYFESYRFSEDLDFTCLDTSIVLDKQFIFEVLEVAHHNSGVLFHLDGFDAMKHNDVVVCQKAVIRYWGADHQKNSAAPPPERWHTFIKIEIVTNEILLFDTSALPLIHDYSDGEELAIIIPCYDLQEVIVEKLSKSYASKKIYCSERLL